MICSSGKRNGQNSDDENDSGSPNENGNAVYNERHHRIVFVEA